MEKFNQIRYNYREIKTPIKNNEQLVEISDILLSAGFVKAFKLSDGKMDISPSDKYKVLSGQFFTQVEVIGAKEDGVFLREGRYRLEPYSPIKSYVNVHYFENWNYGKEDEPFWQKYYRGN